MNNLIKNYQDAYEKAFNKLKNNSNVIGIIVYGSIISGDLWEESDIDFFVITKEQGKLINIYSKISDIPVQVNYISKEIFIKSYKNLLKGGTFHKAFFSGKLVYCLDDEIKDVYDSIRFYYDRDKNIRNMEILCNILNCLHYSRKYYNTGKHETSFQWIVELITNYARLHLNMKGHITDKDILSFAVNMDNDIEGLFKKINSQLSLKERIKYVIDSVQAYLDENISEIALPLIEFLRNKKTLCSVHDIKNSQEFKQVNADLNLILEYLYQKGIINQSLRTYTTLGNEELIDEICYFAL
ncbi:Nucleotidyltransferase domain protein [Caloramator mitchellensis]|uniref:Nucleotidyltransferase domain protein n=1 Tax=Caloramator mitchellensis TaxID=908809 RepID=A0A0R3JV93_CALMK|nr:nucleotidyltransferase domain-containing protein [Caloramator mitchellensis]KRQ87495.1 Nucleotidyltransferase domain protein [Caloramator mitchellensis]